MNVGDLVTIRSISGIGVIISTLSGVTKTGRYFDVYHMSTGRFRTVFCHARELELVSESR